jgi:hypothetical protein
MPVILKPPKTNTILDFLYQNVDLLTPTPLIAREALTRATLAALPEIMNESGSFLTSNVIKNIASDTIQAIPKRHIEGIKHVDVVSPAEVAKMGESIAEYISGYYVPSQSAIFLVKGRALPSTTAHEVGHHVFYVAEPKNIMSVIRSYDKIPLSDLARLTDLGGALINDPAELFAQLYSLRIADSLAKRYGYYPFRYMGKDLNSFFNIIKNNYPELYNIPYRMPPYKGIW